MCCSSSSAPDYSGVAAANSQASQYAKQAADNDLAFRQQVYADARPYAQGLAQLSQQVAQQQLSMSQDAQNHSNQQWNDYVSNYQPLEHQMVQDAMNYGGAADQQQQAGRAVADVNAQMSNQRGQSMRALSSMGVNPNSGRMAAMARQSDIMGAASAAGAATNARTNARNQGVSLRSGAAAFGRNMPNTAGQMIGLSTNAGSASVANTNTGYLSGLPYAQYASGGYGSQIGAAGLQSQSALGLGNLMTNNYQIQQAANSASSSGLGSLVGNGLMAYALMGSDPRLKENVEIVGVDASTGLRLYEFNYIGHPETRYRGVMADEVEKKYPDAVDYDDYGFAKVNYGMLGMKMVEVAHGV